MEQSIAFVPDRHGRSIVHASAGSGRPLVCDTGTISHLEVQLERGGGDEVLTDELLEAMAEQPQSGRPRHLYGKAWRQLEGERGVPQAEVADEAAADQGARPAGPTG